MFSPPSSKSNRRSTRVGRGTTSSRRNAWGKSNSRDSGGSSSHGGLRKGKARKWAQVKRPPAPGVGFTIPTWVPVSQLTEEERQLVKRKSKAKHAKPREPPIAAVGPNSETSDQEFVAPSRTESTVSFSAETTGSQTELQTEVVDSKPVVGALEKETGGQNDSMDVEEETGVSTQPDSTLGESTDDSAAQKEIMSSTSSAAICGTETAITDTVSKPLVEGGGLLAMETVDINVAVPLLGKSKTDPSPAPEGSNEVNDAEVDPKKMEATDNGTNLPPHDGSKNTPSQSLEASNASGTDVVPQTTAEAEKGTALPLPEQSKTGASQSIESDKSHGAGAASQTVSEPIMGISLPAHEKSKTDPSRAGKTAENHRATAASQTVSASDKAEASSVIEGPQDDTRKQSAVTDPENTAPVSESKQEGKISSESPAPKMDSLSQAIEVQSALAQILASADARAATKENDQNTTTAQGIVPAEPVAPVVVTQPQASKSETIEQGAADPGLVTNEEPKNLDSQQASRTSSDVNQMGGEVGPGDVSEELVSDSETDRPAKRARLDP